jgi:hypothetical protein
MGAINMALMEQDITEEKRKYTRYEVDLPIRYSRTNIFFKFGRATNASEGGLLVYLREKMEAGQDLALKLFFPPRSELNSLETSVQVVWTDMHLRKDWAWDYRTGVRFVNISPEDRAKFKNFLMTLPQNPTYDS